ncbi:MAG: CotH kinase family protein [Muribaculaceae bacterium]|nr:CotH kinase family protein [Muribaculaceae bacterium]
MYINTPSPIESKDEWVKKCTIQIANAGESNIQFEKVQMKGRGNTTWSFPKKPYAIKLDKKSEVLGMAKHKRWCLLANWLDRTNIRNDVMLEIGNRLTGLEWTPSGKFVDLVFNGKFEGTYYLCEQIKVDPNRVNITEMTNYDINGDAITGGYLIELDKNFDEVNKFRSKILDFPVNFKDPDEEILQPEQFAYMENYFNEVEFKLTNHADYSEIEALLDIDSFIDWWLVYEIAGTWEPNGPKSCYMYKKRNGKLYAGPVWDFDWGTFRANSGWTVREAVWYPYLIKYPEYVRRVKERWSMAKLSLATIPEYIRTVSKTIAESSEYDCKLWPINMVVNFDEQLTYQESIDKLLRIYEERMVWIDKNIDKLTNN